MFGKMKVVCNALENLYVLVSLTLQLLPLLSIDERRIFQCVQCPGRGGLLRTKQLMLKRKENKSVSNRKGRCE